MQKFTEWALKCIGFHSRCQGNKDRVNQNSAVQIQLQLSAFKTFLDLAGNHLTGKDFTEAFDAACFPLTLFSSSFDPGWASGISATAIQGLLGMLVEGGADNVNQCFLEASRFGSTELVRILLQVITLFFIFIHLGKLKLQVIFSSNFNGTLVYYKLRSTNSNTGFGYTDTTFLEKVGYGITDPFKDILIMNIFVHVHRET